MRKLQSLIAGNGSFIVVDPLGYIDFLSLLVDADFVLTDSGGIQEETTALGVACITMRTSTERPITCEIGSNVLVPPEQDSLRRAIATIIDETRKNSVVPPLWDGKASERIAKIIVTNCIGEGSLKSKL